MRSYRVHACTPDSNGTVRYVVLSLCGATRVSIDMTSMQETAAKTTEAVALTLEALYDLLQGKPCRVERNDGAIYLCPDGPQLVIQKEGHRGTHRVWMAELALAWNMLAGFEATPINTRWNIQ